MILIVGGESTIGKAIARFLEAQGVAVATTSRRPGSDLPLDLAGDDLDAQTATLPACTAAILCAAICTEDGCRRDPATAHKVNVANTVRLAEKLHQRGCFPLFLSTNLVFGDTPHTPVDAPRAPTTIYGAHKAEAEAAIAPFGGILRLSKVLAADHPLFAKWCAALAAEQKVEAASNLFMAPVSLDLAARAAGMLALERAAGIHQLSGESDLSYAQALDGVARERGFDPALISPVALDLGPALRRHTTLALDDGLAGLGIRRPGWSQVVADLDGFRTAR